MQHLDRIRSYSELAMLDTFAERLAYLKLEGAVGFETFGSERWVNQRFYTSSEWRRFRRQIILRDFGCDLGIPGYDVARYGVIHHINPIRYDDLVNSAECLMDPENSIFVSPATHRVIHYGDLKLACLEHSDRTPNDTCPWKGAK